MNNHLIDGFSIATNISLYNQIDKFSTAKVAKEKMSEFKTSWLEKHKSGGITSSTLDVFYAFLDCIAPTMEDVRKKQPQVFQESCSTGNFFAFVHLNTLATKVNSLQDESLASMRLKRKTIHNQIKRLMQAGIITDKKNYRSTGKHNPIPDELDPKGRGKIQLYINKDILKFKAIPSPSLPLPEQSLPLYGKTIVLPILKSKELKLIIDNAPTVDNAVSAIADDVSFDIRGKEQGRKIAPTMQDFEAKNKKDFLAWQQLNLCRSELFAMREMNATLEQKTIEIIKQRITLIEKEVQCYKSQKIKTFCEREKYKNSKYQVSMLNKYCEKLPNTERAAVEIFSHAVQKQAKNAKNNGYFHRIGCPPDFLLSENFTKAINYSMSDWIKIQDKYFIKNQRFSEYCNELGVIGRLYTTVLDVAHESIAFAYSQTAVAYQNFKARLSQNTALTDSNKKALENIFVGKFKPMFQGLNTEQRNKIEAAVRSN